MRLLNAFGLVFLLCALTAAGGCSYRPLYGKAANGGSVAAALGDVSVEEQKSRAGQLVRNGLISGIGATGSGTSRYQLRLLPEETTTKISSVSGQKVERYRYGLKVGYALVDKRSGDSLTEGTSFSHVSYDTVDEPVADMRAADSARERASGEISQDIRTRIAAFMAAGS